MEDLQIFNFDNQNVRTLLIDDEPYFVGKDIAEILGYSNTRDALAKRVDEEDKYGVAIRDSIGRQQNVVAINESGLYSLILSSKLPTAKKFKRWVTKEVLPAIRKTGSYSKLNNSKLSPELQMFGTLYKALAKQELTTKNLNNKINSVTEIISLDTTDWRRKSRALIAKIAEKQNGINVYQRTQSDIYKATDKRANSDLNRRLLNLKKKLAYNGATQTKLNNTNKLDVIDRDKRLKEIYMAVVKDFAIKYKVWDQEY